MLGIAVALDGCRKTAIRPAESIANIYGRQAFEFDLEATGGLACVVDRVEVSKELSAGRSRCNC